MSETELSEPRFGAIDEVDLWRRVVEGTAGETGEGFFAQLVQSLSEAVGTHGAWITEWRPLERRLLSRSCVLGGQLVKGFDYDIDGTPCERVVEQRGEVIHIPDDIIALYPNNPNLRATNAVSFMGMALTDLDGTVLGHLAVLDNRPMPPEPRLEALFRVFCSRAVAELRRLRAEAQVREREAKLARLVDGAMDAIVDLDAELKVTHANTAAAKIFGVKVSEFTGASFGDCLEAESSEKLRGLARALDLRPEGRRASWVAGGLTARLPDGAVFPTEASLSRSQDDEGRPYYTLVLRDVNERLAAERTIELLASEADYLRAKLSVEEDRVGMVGEGPAFQRLRRGIEEVAPTDATVLVTGETGTGKELVADALHEYGRRDGARLVKVNCGAIPENLIESEFFGHEAGAYTGATRAREGRFTLADGGTIFLDEIGELPLALQPKLLRVLQSGEFEPVGSSKTRRVRVRVVAATHRDLREEVKAGRFREDLYYRLAVFPIRVPALRERREDIPLLVRAFVERISKRMGKSVEPPSDFELAQMQRYDWPGNIRELINVVERALITARGGSLDLLRALGSVGDLARARPESAPESSSDSDAAVKVVAPAADEILTVDGLREFEKLNLERALARCDGQIGGAGGAAELLGMKPSTLRSRLVALGLAAPKK